MTTPTTEAEHKVTVDAEGLHNLARHAQRIGTQNDWMRVALTWIDAANSEIAALREQVATLLDEKEDWKSVALENNDSQRIKQLEDDNAALRQEWHTVDGDFPRPHARYFVRRENEIFTATPCYGMHEPWWVPRLLGKESEPITMLVTDKYVAMREGKENK